MNTRTCAEDIDYTDHTEIVSDLLSEIDRLRRELCHANGDVAQLKILYEEIHSERELLRSDIERKDSFIELLQAQVSALKALEVLGRLFQLADELDARDSAGMKLQ